MENEKYVVVLYKYDVIEVGNLFVILHIYNKFSSSRKKKQKKKTEKGCQDKFICFHFTH